MPDTAASRKSPRVAGSAAGPGVGDSAGWRAAAGTGGAPEAVRWQDASEVERLLVERLIVDVVDDMELYVRDAVEEQVEEVADIERGIERGWPERRTYWLVNTVLEEVLGEVLEEVAAEAMA